MSDQTERAAKDLGVWAFGEVRLDDCPKETIFRALVRVYEAREKWQSAWQEATWERNKAQRELSELRASLPSPAPQRYDFEEFKEIVNKLTLFGTDEDWQNAVAKFHRCLPASYLASSPAPQDESAEEFHQRTGFHIYLSRPIVQIERTLAEIYAFAEAYAASSPAQPVGSSDKEP